MYTWLSKSDLSQSAACFGKAGSSVRKWARIWGTKVEHVGVPKCWVVWTQGMAEPLYIHSSLVSFAVGSTTQINKLICCALSMCPSEKSSNLFWMILLTLQDNNDTTVNDFHHSFQH